MYKKLFFLAILAFFNLNINAQEKPEKNSNIIEVGFNLSQFQSDFGTGFHLISPYFLKSKVAVRAGVNLQWLEYFNGEETTWTPYQNFQIGLRSRNEIVENKIYIYGEGGLITILPKSEFSSESLEFGGYGLFGFEFKPTSYFAYFIEIGGVGTGARADELPTQPIYSNGLLINVGLRVGF